jgi:hypothetical protein
MLEERVKNLGEWLEGGDRQFDVIIVQALHCVPSHVLELREDQEGTSQLLFLGIVG